MPRGLVVWLEEQSGEFTQSSANPNYYEPPITFKSLQQFLKNNQYASRTLRCAYILAINSTTLQNSLHYCASGNLFVYNEEMAQQLCLNDESIPPKTIRETATDEARLILQELLYYIQSGDQQLKLLEARDGNYNTILMSAFTGTLAYAAFAPLLEFVIKNKDIEHFNFSMFALRQNVLGETIFHRMTDKIAGFCASIFGLGVLQEAFITTDNLGGMPLHYVCISTTAHKFADVKFICELLRNASTTTNNKLIRLPIFKYKIEDRFYEDHEALTKTFSATRMGHTPLHILCINASSDDIPIIDYLRTEFSDYYKIQLQHKDNLGNLPGHYAAKANALTFMKALLSGLELEEQRAMMLQPNRADETIIDFAIKFADDATVEYCLDVLGYDQFYEYQQNHPELAALAAENSRLTKSFASLMQQHTILYFCTAYFVKLSASYPTDIAYIQRFNDFRECLEHIHTHQTHLPVAIPALQYDSWMLFFNTENEYFGLRKHIKTTMQPQLDACKTYFLKKYSAGVAKDLLNSLFSNVRRASVDSPSLSSKPGLTKA